MTATHKSVLLHVVENILQAASDNPLNQCTVESGFDFFSDLLSLSEMDITSAATGREKP